MTIRRKPSPTAPTLKYGDTFGDYIINGFAGTGATSYVYRARRIDSFEPVAIKVLHPHLLRDTIKRRRFLREAQVMMKFSHHNIVNFHEIIDHPKQLAFVMEYIEGMTLNEWRNAYAKDIDEAALSCIFVDILRGLSHAHHHGIVHRDLKPANILITHTNGRFVAKIIDFGVARILQENVASDERLKIVGTAAYISPEEVLDPELVEARSDLYSLGVMLYEAATGQRPFEHMPVQDLLQAHVHTTPTRPRRINPDLTPAFESIILRTLDKNPKDRFPSAPDMIRGIESALQSAISIDEKLNKSLYNKDNKNNKNNKDNKDNKDNKEYLSINPDHTMLNIPKRRDHKVISFLGRCIQSAYVLFTSTGATGRLNDPHHMSRHVDTHLPLS